MSSVILFKEVQLLPQKWIWIIVLLINGLLLFAYFAILFSQDEAKNEKKVMLLIAICLTAVVTIVLKGFCLVTNITSDGIYIKFAPFHSAFIYYSWDAISNITVITYNPLLEYGGWGIRYRMKGTAYSMTGDTGIELLLTNGRKIMIGTREPYAAAEALKKLGRLK